jgi:hypothetical protein
MIKYNVTIKIPDALAEEWLHWMQQVHIPDVMSTGLFDSGSINELLEYEDDPDRTFSIIQNLASRIEQVLVLLVSYFRWKDT